jgi:tRNA A-37 threonylcarbamoyl transferase component Bud32
MWGDPDLPFELMNTLWSDPAELARDGELLRQNGARRTVRIAWGARRLIVKHYVEPTPWHAAKQLVRPSRATATWRITRRFIDLGIATPRPLARVENRWGPLRRDSYLVYEYVEGDTLRQYLRSGSPDGTPLVEQLCRQCAEMWDRLTEAGISLSDPNMGNFVVSTDGRLWVIDLDKSKFHARAVDGRRGFRRSWNLFVANAQKTGADAVRFVNTVRLHMASAKGLRGPLLSERVSQLCGETERLRLPLAGANPNWRSGQA